MFASTLGKRKQSKPPPLPGEGSPARDSSSQILQRVNYKKVRKQQQEIAVTTPLSRRHRRNSLGGISSTSDQLNNHRPGTQPGGGTGGFPTFNQYEALDFDISGDDEENNNNGGDGETAAAGNGAAVGSVVKNPVPVPTKVRCPPIFVYGSSVPALNRLLSTTQLGIDDYHLRVNKGHIQIRVSTKIHFTAVVSKLKNSDAQFYTHGTSDETPVKIVLSGLPVFPVEDVKLELESVFLRPTSVRQMGKSKHGDYALYLLQFEKGTVKLQELQQIKALFNVIVRWRHYSKRGRVNRQKTDRQNAEWQNAKWQKITWQKGQIAE